jgi:hypothetical protein
LQKSTDDSDVDETFHEEIRTGSIGGKTVFPSSSFANDNKLIDIKRVNIDDCQDNEELGAEHSQYNDDDDDVEWGEDGGEGSAERKVKSEYNESSELWESASRKDGIHPNGRLHGRKLVMWHRKSHSGLPILAAFLSGFFSLHDVTN